MAGPERGTGRLRRCPGHRETQREHPAWLPLSLSLSQLSSPAHEAGRHRGAEGGEPPREATQEVSKSLVQRLTASAETSDLSPSEVNVLCSGQSSSTQSSFSTTCSPVLLADNITLHMLAAALQAHSSVSAVSQPQRLGLGHHGCPGWLPALPLPTAPRRQHPAGLPLRAAGGRATVP